MFDTIILLAGEAGHVVLPLALRGHNPHLTVVTVRNAADLAALPPDLLARARLIAFVTPEIVSNTTLALLGYGAFNFHPAPPSYPGSAPAHFALYEQATGFKARSAQRRNRPAAATSYCSASRRYRSSRTRTPSRS
jgi:methionyl-tRNA formyltransferase